MADIYKKIITVTVIDEKCAQFLGEGGGGLRPRPPAYKYVVPNYATETLPLMIASFVNNFKTI